MVVSRFFLESTEPSFHRFHYINTLKQELNGTKAYEETSSNEKTVVNSHLSHSNELPYKFAVDVKERQDKLPTM